MDGIAEFYGDFVCLTFEELPDFSKVVTLL